MTDAKENGEIECPFHQSRFDIKIGKPSYAPCREAMRMRTVHVEDGKICNGPSEMHKEG